ncbi:MAG: SIR2 family protein [Chloroflexi bacterium]|nr:SIR2 family protein [Chloroflexota bacterium]
MDKRDSELDPTRIEELVILPELSSLRTSFEQGKLEFLVGAGSSIAAGLPGWNVLNKRLIRKFFEKEVLAQCLKKALVIDEKNNNFTFFRDRIDFESEELDALAATFERYFGRDAVIDLLRAEIHHAAGACEEDGGALFDRLLHEALYEGISHYDLQPIHYEIAAATVARQKPRVVYTANYDDILEHALEQILRAQGNTSAERVKSITSRSAKDLGVVHIHGYLPLKEKKSRGKLVLSEKDYLSGYGSWADKTLGEILGQNKKDLLLVGLSLSDPRLRRLLHKRAEIKRQGTKGLGDIYVILSRGRDLDAFDLATRKAKRIAVNYSEPYWQSWGIHVISVDTPELIPVLIRQIRLGMSPAEWVKKGHDFLQNQNCYEGLYSEERQAQNQISLMRQYALIRDKFSVSRDELFNLNFFAPSDEEPGSIQLVFQFAGDFRRHRSNARWSRVDLQNVPLSLQLGSEYYHRPENCLYVQTLDESHAKTRRLKVGTWEDVQGASGFAYLSGTLVDARNKKWFYHRFTPEQAAYWDSERVFSSLLVVPIYDSPEWVPVGVASVTSTYSQPFWTQLSPEELLNLARLLRSTFRNLLGYTSGF